MAHEELHPVVYQTGKPICGYYHYCRARATVLTAILFGARRAVLPYLTPTASMCLVGALRTVSALLVSTARHAVIADQFRSHLRRTSCAAQKLVSFLVISSAFGCLSLSGCTRRESRRYALRAGP